MADDTPEPTPVPAYRHRPAVVLFLGVTAFMLTADLVIKYLAFAHVADRPVVLTPEVVASGRPVPEHDAINVAPGLLSLKLTTNKGAVFGIGQGKKALFITVSLVAVLVIGYVFSRGDKGAYVQHTCLALILAGALGNLYDRIMYSVVRDMFWLFPGRHLPFGWRWPQGGSQWLPWVENTGPPDLYPWIFNVADVSLVVGVLIMMVLMWRAPQPTPDADTAGKPAPTGQKATG